jgi:hypothetical protein
MELTHHLGYSRLDAVNGRDAVAPYPDSAHPPSPIPYPPNPYPLNKHPSAEEDAVLVDGHDLAGGEAALG